MSKPKVVLFDLGNVLVDFRPVSFWNMLGLRNDADRKPYEAGVEKAGAKFESGLIHTGQFLEELESVFEKEFGVKELQTAVASVLTDPVEGMESVVREAARTALVGLVSNTNEFHYAYCLSAIPALKLLPKHYLSYKLGVMKPDALFYRKVIEDQNLDPSEMLFIDDVEENIRAAEKAGMKGIVFENAGKLEEELKRLVVGF